MEYKPNTGEPENIAVADAAEFELDWQLNRDAPPADENRKHAAEEECVGAPGPGTEYWLP